MHSGLNSGTVDFKVITTLLPDFPLSDKMEKPLLKDYRKIYNSWLHFLSTWIRLSKCII
jgi:hypothetical protein